MLDKNALKDNIEAGLRDIVAPAIEECILRTYPGKSDIGDKTAEQFKLNFDKLVSEQLAEVLASAIDYYVRNIEIYGKIWSSPLIPHSMFQAKINSFSMPMLNGTIPNSLGIK